MIDKTRLIKPTDDFKSAFAGLGFRNNRSLRTAGEKVLLVDPTYVADVYNSIDEDASYLRKHGLFLMDFGGDTSTPVWWKMPYLLMPISNHLSKQDLELPRGTKVLRASNKKTITRNSHR